ncbi:hypothetical protein CFC21_104306, partial [Triticum aestivum]
Q